MASEPYWFSACRVYHCFSWPLSPCPSEQDGTQWVTDIDLELSAVRSKDHTDARQKLILPSLCDQLSVITQKWVLSGSFPQLHTLYFNIQDGTRSLCCGFCPEIGPLMESPTLSLLMLGQTIQQTCQVSGCIHLQSSPQEPKLPPGCHKSRAEATARFLAITEVQITIPIANKFLRPYSNYLG